MEKKTEPTVWGLDLGFRVWGLWFGVQGLVFVAKSSHVKPKTAGARQAGWFLPL